MSLTHLRLRSLLEDAKILRVMRTNPELHVMASSLSVRVRVSLNQLAEVRSTAPAKGSVLTVTPVHDCARSCAMHVSENTQSINIVFVLFPMINDVKPNPHPAKPANRANPACHCSILLPEFSLLWFIDFLIQSIKHPNTVLLSFLNK